MIIVNTQINYSAAREVWRLVNPRRGELLSRLAAEGGLGVNESLELQGLNHYTDWYCETCWGRG